MRVEAIQLSDTYQTDRMVSEGGPIHVAPVVKNSCFPEVKGRRAPVSDPILRGVEELAIVTGRVEVLDQLK